MLLAKNHYILHENISFHFNKLLKNSGQSFVPCKGDRFGRDCGKANKIVTNENKSNIIKRGNDEHLYSSSSRTIFDPIISLHSLLHLMLNMWRRLRSQPMFLNEIIRVVKKNETHPTKSFTLFSLNDP